MGSKLFEFTLFEDLLYYNYSDGSDEPKIWVFSNWLVTHSRKLILQIFHTRFFNIKEEDVKVLFALRKKHWTTEWYQRQLLSSSHPVQTVSQRAKIWRNTRYCLCKVKSSNFKCHFIQLSRYNLHTIRILIIGLFILEQNLCHDDYLVGDVIHIHFQFFFLLVVQIDNFILSIEFSFRSWSGYLIWTMKRLEGIWWWYTYRWKFWLLET